MRFVTNFVTNSFDMQMANVQEPADNELLHAESWEFHQQHQQTLASSEVRLSRSGISCYVVALLLPCGARAGRHGSPRGPTRVEIMRQHCLFTGSLQRQHNRLFTSPQGL